ncbi:MAG: HAD family hydrolase [Actinomycetota bacterium]
MVPELVIFDCDGVLVDSETLIVDIEARMLTAAGFPLTRENVIERFVGLSYGVMMDRLEAEFGRPVPLDLKQQVEQAALDELALNVTAVPGIAEVLKGLHAADRARCVASSSDLSRITMTMDVAGVSAWFDPAHIFSVQMVERPKPAPDVFLHAAAELGSNPDRCLVVEDSPHGVEAALAAGMDVVGLTAGGHAGPVQHQRLVDAGAGHVFATTAELGDHLGLD